MFFYWIFDNIQILSVLKLVEANADRWGQLGMLGWSISLTANLLQFIRQLFQVNGSLAEYAKRIVENPEKQEAFKEEIKKAKIQRFELMLNLIKTLGDILPAFKGASTFDLTQKSRTSWA